MTGGINPPQFLPSEDDRLTEARRRTDVLVRGAGFRLLQRKGDLLNGVVEFRSGAPSSKSVALDSATDWHYSEREGHFRTSGRRRITSRQGQPAGS